MTVAIDASDGALARAVQVRERIPYFDGALLDNIVDYLTYVAAPVFLMVRARVIPDGRTGEAVACFAMIEGRTSAAEIAGRALVLGDCR